MQLSEKEQAHLLKVFMAKESEAVFSVLNKTDKKMLAALTDRDIELFIKDRNSRYCFLLGGYLGKHE